MDSPVRASAGMAVAGLLLMACAASMAAANTVVVSTANIAIGKTVSINILHTNDQHARYEQASNSLGTCSPANDAAGLCHGGSARIATVVKEFRAIDPETLYLDAGDQYMGTMFDNLYRGNQSARFLHAVGANVTTLGNHEFDWRVTNLAANIKAAQPLGIPYLGACNVDVSKAPSMKGLLKKYVTFTVKGFRIAVLGVLTAETNYADLQPVDNVTVTDEAAGVKSCVAELKKLPASQRPDVTIVLSHSGYEVDKIIAAKVGGIDLIIGGHSHSFLWGNGSTYGPLLNRNTTGGATADYPLGPYPTWVASNVTHGKVVPVTQAYWASRYMGSLRLTMDPIKRKLLSITGTPILLGGYASANPVVPDPKVAAMIAEMAGPITAYSNQVIGSATADIKRGGYGSESPMGTIATQGILDYISPTWKTDEEGPLFMCLINSGGLRADISSGPITIGSAFAVQPFGNLLAVKQINGYTLFQALENGVSALNTPLGGGRWPQLAGISMVYDARQPPFARIKSAKIIRPGSTTPEAIDACQTYNLAAYDYVFNGGDNYTALATSGRSVLASGVSQEVAFFDYIQANSPITPKVRGLIKSCTGDANDDPACAAPYAPILPCSGTVNPKPK